MLLNIVGVTAPMVQNVLQRYPTPRALVEAIDGHARACALRQAAPLQCKWLLEDLLVPGHRRRKLSETVCNFFCVRDLDSSAPTASQG